MTCQVPLLGLAAAVALVACKPSRETYIERFASLSCELSETCSPDAFAATFEDLDECITFYADFLAATPGEEDGCTYDAQAADTCLEELRDATCDASVEYQATTCSSVFVGDGCTVVSDSGGDS